jgi:hypothetical protein
VGEHRNILYRASGGVSEGNCLAMGIFSAAAVVALDPWSK